jgi:membrane peptidoglycan carboxypeptidase
VITLGEAANAYQTLKDGVAYRTRHGEDQMLVERITTREGKVIYEDWPERKQILSDRTRFALEAILGSVVEGGTGRRIQRDLRMRAGDVAFSVPAYGKTGTTNDYRNGAFLGFIAAPKGPGRGFDAVSGFTLAAYSGFDDNTRMIRRGFRGTGSSVAIPAWLGIAQDLVLLENFAERADLYDLETQSAGIAPRFQRELYRQVYVSKRTGLPLSVEPGLSGEAYVEDLSDELDEPEGIPASPDLSASTLLIREE